MLAAYAGGAVRLWDLTKNGTSREIQLPYRPGHISLTLSPDGERLATGGCARTGSRAGASEFGEGCVKGRIDFWSVVTGKRTAGSLAAHTDEVTSLAFTPDGKRLLSASGAFDGRIIVWDPRERRRLTQFAASDTGISALTVSPAPTLVASTSNAIDPSGYDIALRDLASGRTLGPALTGHSALLWAIAFSPVSSTLASADGDGAVLTWDLALSTLDAIACTIVNRDLTRSEWRDSFGDEKYEPTCPT
jgi:WD40 repeat protein